MKRTVGPLGAPALRERPAFRLKNSSKILGRSTAANQSLLEGIRAYRARTSALDLLNLCSCQVVYSINLGMIVEICGIASAINWEASPFSFIALARLSAALLMRPTARMSALVRSPQRVFIEINRDKWFANSGENPVNRVLVNTCSSDFQGRRQRQTVQFPSPIPMRHSAAPALHELGHAETECAARLVGWPAYPRDVLMLDYLRWSLKSDGGLRRKSN